MNTLYNPKGRVFDVQRFCVHDGPGIRTTVFLKGCPLHCAWCHNPESWNAENELMYTASLCMQCGACAAACAQNVHSFDGGHVLARANCIGCMACTDACPTSALSTVGEEKSVDEVMKTVLRDRDFYRENGGLTVSGGEPFMQSEFLLALLQAAKGEGLHTAVETSGACRSADLLAAIPYTDLFLYDCKMMPGEAHRRYIGVEGSEIVNNLRLLDANGAHTVLRCPILPGINDTEAHFAYIRDLANSLQNLCAIHIEPYHATGISKAENLGKTAAYAYKIDAAAFRARICDTLLPDLQSNVSVPVEVL